MKAEGPPAWHALTVVEACRLADASPGGLGAQEVERRRARFGENVIDVRRPVSGWRILRHQFASVVVGLLIAAAALAAVLGDPLEAAAIVVVLLINVVVGFWTEWRARVAVESLRGLQVDHAVVLRDGQPVRLEAREVVPGDVLVLQEGDAVAADARVIEAHELRASEAALTGESMPVGKKTDPVDGAGPAGVALGDRSSMVHKGTSIAGGSGRALVVATGRDTELGRIGELVGSLEHGPTPIERRLSALGRRLVWITLAIAAAMVGVGILGGREIWLVVETGLALAIAAVPEGLPVVATVTLAVGMWRMARRNALVRRPPAVEALGSATVICSDKTGTLTTGHMTATTLVVAGRRVEVSGAGLDLSGEVTVDGEVVSEADRAVVSEAARVGVLANAASLRDSPDGPVAIGDPTDVALLVLGEKLGLDRPELLERLAPIGELPFSSWRMLMASFHREGGDVGVFVKGAVDRVLDRSVRILGSQGENILDEAGREELLSLNHDLAEQGLRVLALARGTCSLEAVGSEDGVRDLTLVGLVGLMDPPVAEVRETVSRFRDAGVRTVMITGDHAATARSVASQLGILRGDERVVSGVEVQAMDEATLRAAVGRIAVYGRVSPEDKLRIVEALQAGGEVVGMLGDGVNDAPALRRADIGVAMGRRGTYVAKDVADLVLADDRLETVGVAVEEGRVIFDNIRKFIFYLFSCNVSEVGVVFVASLAGLPLPLLPLQLLWLNVVTDVFPALALSVEPGEPDVMGRPPRPQSAAILSRGFLIQLLFYGTLITASTLGVFVWALRREGTDTTHAVTLAFMTLAVAQLLHVFNARSFRPITLGRDVFRNGWLWMALAVSMSLQVLSVQHAGLASVLGTRPLGSGDWMIVAAAGSAPLVLGQIWKRIWRARRAAL